MKRLLAIIVILLPLLLVAQNEYELTAYRNVVPNGYNFWLSIPNTYQDHKSEMPVIVFLHGHSLCGNDLYRVRRYGCLDALSMGRKINAMVIAPQNPGGPWKPEKINNVLDWVQAHFEMDTNRIYVIGMSLGGYGTFEYVGTYPDRFAAAMALCGGSNLKDHCGLNKLPLWIIHGTADRDVSVSCSQRIVDAMKACGDTPYLRFDKFKGINHSQLAKMFYLNETYDWLLSHSKNDSVRKVNRDIVITECSLDKAYQNINRSANKIIVVDAARTEKVMVDSVGTRDASSKTVSTSPAYHIVKQGDTLYAIARKYHTTVEKLCKLNHIKETGILSLGQKIKLR